MDKTKDNKKLPLPVQKILDGVEKLTVLELAELVGALEEKFGVSAAAPAAAAQTASPAGQNGEEAAEEKTEFKVELVSFGDKKIQVIKAVRTIKPDLGLADAKKLVESAPVVILENVKKEDAEEAKKKLEEAGGKVELK